MIDVPEFAECALCAAKPGSPTLCPACLHNRATVNQLRAEREALLKVYVLAARLRTFPVPFDEHFQLVGAVDECRSVLEPPVDDYEPARSAPDMPEEKEGDSAGLYPRELVIDPPFQKALRAAVQTLKQSDASPPSAEASGGARTSLAPDDGLP